jgi:hypothetical protein
VFCALEKLDTRETQKALTVTIPASGAGETAVSCVALTRSLGRARLLLVELHGVSRPRTPPRRNGRPGRRAIDEEPIAFGEVALSNSADPVGLLQEGSDNAPDVRILGARGEVLESLMPVVESGRIRPDGLVELEVEDKLGANVAPDEFFSLGKGIDEATRVLAHPEEHTDQDGLVGLEEGFPNREVWPLAEVWSHGPAFERAPTETVESRKERGGGGVDAIGILMGSGEPVALLTAPLATGAWGRERYAQGFRHVEVHSEPPCYGGHADPVDRLKPTVKGVGSSPSLSA